MEEQVQRTTNKSNNSNNMPTKTVAIWKTVINWISFLFQIFIQIIRGSPSFSYPSFKPLPVSDLIENNNNNNNNNNNIKNDGVEITTTFPDLDRPPVTQKLTVVLDLDETLVCAYETSSLPSTVCSQATEAGLKWFELECISSDKEYEGKPKVNYVTVFERPGLHEFLKQLSEFAELVLFTAGLEGYARPLVDRIDVENVFSHRLYRPSTTSTEYREHVKDLSCLSKDLSRTVIVDNNPFSFLLQPVNGIPCIAFSAGQPHDDQLLEVILPLLRHLAEQEDVRHALYDRYHMPEWFQKHGIPCSEWAK